MKCFVHEVSEPLLAQEFSGSHTSGCPPLSEHFRSWKLITALFSLLPQLFRKLLRASQPPESFTLPSVCREPSWGGVGGPGYTARFLSSPSARPMATPKPRTAIAVGKALGKRVDP